MIEFKEISFSELISKGISLFGKHWSEVAVFPDRIFLNGPSPNLESGSIMEQEIGQGVFKWPVMY